MLPSSLAVDLYRAAAPAIAKVLARGGVRSGRPRGEVDAIRTMTLDGFDEIAAAWSPIVGVHGYRIDLRAVFCHSSPQVIFKPLPHPNFPGGKNPRQCELADLLIVIDHVDRLRNIDDRSAVLIQAKMLKSGALKPTGQEWVQHELLAWLPAFEFVDAAYDSRPRKLDQVPFVGLPTHTAEYAGLDLSSTPPEWRHELTRTTAPWFHSPISLARYLAFMATGSPSCGRDAIKGGTDDWSFTVDELLRVTAARPIAKKYCVARGNDNIVGFIAETSPSTNRSSTESHDARGSSEGNGNSGEYHYDRENGDWPEGPLSTVHMTVSPINDRPED